MDLSLGYRGMNPPVPSSSTTRPSHDSEGSIDTAGRRLMALVRSIESEQESSNRSELILEATAMLANLIHVYSRRGLLEGDVAKAKKLLDISTTTAGSNSSGATSSRRPNKRARSSGHDDLGTTADNKDQSAGVEDEILFLSAIVRLLGGTHKLSEPAPPIASDLLELVTLAAAICTCLADHARKNDDVCALGEQEVLFRVGRSILTGIAVTLRSLSRDDVDTDSGQNGAAVILSSLSAASSLTSLFGSRLGRSFGILQSLQTSSWDLLPDRNSNIQWSAATVLASLPLAGANNKIEPADVWANNLADTIAALSMILDGVAPVVSSSSSPKKRPLSDEMQKRVTTWIHLVSEGNADEEERTLSFISTVRGLAYFVLALLSRDGYDARNSTAMIAARLPVESLLDVVQTMISYPSAAESHFYSTRKRLRSETIEGGLLSISSIAVHVANPVKSLGHDILDAVILSIGGPRLLPFARRISRITQASLLASSSTTLRKALDPTSHGRIDIKRKRWLHTSLAIRAKSIRSFRIAVTAFGSNLVVSSREDGTNRGRSSECAKGIALTGGCLLEQLSHQGDNEHEVDDDWGSFGERVALAACTCEALASILGTTGAYLPLATRSLLDSIATTCLSEVAGKLSNNAVCGQPSVKAAVLNFGLLCVTTPWPDGAASRILEDMKSAAKACKNDTCAAVAMQRLSCLRQCDALSTPRSPPLELVTRATDSLEAPDRKFMSALSLIESLRSTREEMHAQEQSQTTVSDIQSLPSGKEHSQKVDPVTVDTTRSPSLRPAYETNTDDTATAMASARMGSTEAPADEALSPGLPTHKPDVSVAEKEHEKTRSSKMELHGETRGLGDHDVDTTLQNDDELPTRDNKYMSASEQDDNGDEDDDDLLPEIVDCGPDEEDR